MIEISLFTHLALIILIYIDYIYDDTEAGTAQAGTARYIVHMSIHACLMCYSQALQAGDVKVFIC